MDRISFTREEVRVLKAMVANNFEATDPVTISDLMSRGYLKGDPDAPRSLHITFMGRVALKEWQEQNQPP
jgi:hypothetical protein